MIITKTYNFLFQNLSATAVSISFNQTKRQIKLWQLFSIYNQTYSVDNISQVRKVYTKSISIKGLNLRMIFCNFRIHSLFSTWNKILTSEISSTIERVESLTRRPHSVAWNWDTDWLLNTCLEHSLLENKNGLYLKGYNLWQP